jgi:hypothetical protein
MADKDDLDAVREVIKALEGMAAEDQERVIRWAREKLGLPASATQVPLTINGLNQQPQMASASPPVAVNAMTSKDLRTFIAEKDPKSDVQFAAAVAYYYRFEASESQQKGEIGADDLREACRLVNRERFSNPLQTLQNARNLGLLDRPGRGMFSINSVGENLVAMTLPSDQRQITARKGKRSVAKTSKKKAARK